MRIGLGEYGPKQMFPSVAQRETEWRDLDFGRKRDLARIISQLDGDMFPGRRKICFQTENRGITEYKSMQGIFDK